MSNDSKEIITCKDCPHRAPGANFCNRVGYVPIFDPDRICVHRKLELAEAEIAALKAENEALRKYDVRRLVKCPIDAILAGHGEEP